MKNRFTFIAAFVAIIYALGIVTPSLFNVYAMETTEESKIILPKTSSAQVDILGVRNDGEGILNKGNVEIREGEGRVLISTMPFIEPTTQFSFEIAKEVAERFTGVSLDDKDIIFSVSETRADLIGGPSAGAIFTVATIAAIEGRQVRDDVTLSGTIQRDGTIGPVGGLVEKLEASAENGNTLFLIPKGQEIFTFVDEEPVTRNFGIFSFQTKEFVRKQINLKEHGFESFGIDVREVGNINDAIKYLLV